MLKIYDDSKNYTCTVIKLPTKQKVEGLDNLVKVNVFGNDCLISKDSDEEQLYLFFPAECQLSKDFLHNNNLYRHSELNKDNTKKGFFEDNGRVKTIKFKGIISSGFVIPLSSLSYIKGGWNQPNGSLLKIGDEFNEYLSVHICNKYIKPQERIKGISNPKTRKINDVLDGKFAPEHMDTSHLMKNVHKLKLNDYIAVTYKLHGTSARYYNTLVKRPLKWYEKLAKKLGVKVQEEHYDFVSGSRRCIKSVGFEELPGKNHFFNSGDLWSAVGKEFFENKLNQGEAIYCEIIGKTYAGEAIQHGYTYQLEKPKVCVYRISMINSQGIEIDLPYQQMKERCIQLGVDSCPELFYGNLGDFISVYTKNFGILNIEEGLNNVFYDILLEKSSILDNSVIEEGFCIRIDKYPKPEIFKIKSKAFLLHEGHSIDKQVIDIEEEQTV